MQLSQAVEAELEGVFVQPGIKDVPKEQTSDSNYETSLSFKDIAELANIFI